MKNGNNGKSKGRKKTTRQEFPRSSMPKVLIRPQGTPCLSDCTASHFSYGKVWKVGWIYKTISSFCSSIGWLSHTLLNTVNPTSHHPLRKNPEVFQSAKNQVIQRKTHLSVASLVIFPPIAPFLTQWRVQISKEGFLIILSQPEKERKIKQKSAGEMCSPHYPQLSFTILFLILPILCQLTLLFWQKRCLCMDQELKLNPSLNFPVITYL